MTMKDLMAQFQNGDISDDVFQSEMLRLAAEQNGQTAAKTARKAVKCTISKTGGLSIPGRKLGAGMYPVWGYATQWIRLLADSPEILAMIYARENGPVEGDSNSLSVFVPNSDGEGGTSRPLKPGDLPDKTETIKGIIARLQAMLPAETPVVPPVPVVVKEPMKKPAKGKAKDKTEEPSTVLTTEEIREAA